MYNVWIFESSWRVLSSYENKVDADLSARIIRKEGLRVLVTIAGSPLDARIRSHCRNKHIK